MASREANSDVDLTAAVGDGWLKLPRSFTENVFVHLDIPWMQNDSLPKYLSRLKTPPYVSCTAEVYHRRISRRQDTTNASFDAFLMTCSDGVLDLAKPEPIQLSQSLIDHWVEVIGRKYTKSDRGDTDGQNLAFTLLRDCIGGDDISLASRNLTLEMDERWMDDITIIVQKFA